MHLRPLLAVLALFCASPAFAANTVQWLDAISGVESALQPGGCVKASFTTTNEASESKFLYVGGQTITIQSDGDSAGAGASSGDLFACTSPSLTACNTLNVIDTDGDGIGDDNTVDGGATTGGRGTLRPITVAGWIYADPDATTIDTGEILEVLVCAVR